MATSRSPQEFLVRAGLHPMQPGGRPRLAVDDMLIHTVPLNSPAPGQAALLAYEGDPPPDRGDSRPWPDQPPAQE